MKHVSFSRKLFTTYSKCFELETSTERIED